MRFAPKTEEEIDTRVLLPKGEYDATVTQASDEISSKGADMIHLVLRAKDDQGRSNIVHDYLLEAMAGKLRHFCIATGMGSEYEAGELSAAHCSGMDVRVRLDIEPGKDGYADKNIVRDYITRKSAPAPRQQPAAPINGGTPSPEGLAKKAWLVVWNKFVGEFPQEASNRDEYWQKCFKGYFPGKERAQLSPGNWKQFQGDVSKWDPINGWPKPAAVGAPFGDEQQFSEYDIPF